MHHSVVLQLLSMVIVHLQMNGSLDMSHPLYVLIHTASCASLQSCILENNFFLLTKEVTVFGNNDLKCKKKLSF